ncbi:hypothetical protein ACSFA8_27075 [Variovorax sp. RT4R15]|uniref:hypothetical protein n=1 Tax=Variovorax sp. RT4R15 TaxID=3443737 RepID=UPI003F48EE85
MTQPFQKWTVLPHGKLVQIDENILTVVGEIHMPLMDLPRPHDRGALERRKLGDLQRNRTRRG